ncbi:ATP-binding protein [Streptomyces sp. NPDC088348]|uniref:ATP-binding protein n=1 Tax=Streptomyces sp. NPDC088348 TaxID=3365853 RepID=UPI003802636B
MPHPRRTSHFALPVSHASAREARCLAREALSKWGFDASEPVVDTTLVILTELVTNSVLHAAQVSARVGVSLALSRGRLTVAVHDDHPHCPRPKTETADEHGRGLRIVHELAAEMGGHVHLRPDRGRQGKTVVVVLGPGSARPVPRRGDTPGPAAGPGTVRRLVRYLRRALAAALADRRRRRRKWLSSLVARPF